MNTNNFIKIGQEYVSWSSGVASNEVELVEILGSGSNRTITKYKVIVRDLIDMLLFRCHGYRVNLETSDEKEYVLMNLEDYLVSCNGVHYEVSFSLDELKKLVVINRKESTWDNVIGSPRTKLNVNMLMQFLNKLVKLSIIDFSSKDSKVSSMFGSGVVIVNAFVDEETSSVHITLDKDKVDLLTPQNKYHTKYLADSFVLGSEYCKNFHSFVSFYADVFKRGKFGQTSTYHNTPIEKVAQAMGVRFNGDIRDYCKETKEYSRTSVVQFVKNYTKEINEKTRLKELYGTLNYEIIRDSKRGKVRGFRFYFEEV